MPIFIGDKEIATVFKGDTELDNIQLGDQQQWVGIIVTPDPSINIVSDTTSSITFDLVNNHEETVTIFYEINDPTPDQYSVSVAANSSARRTISGLSPNTTYTIYAYALEADQLPSNVVAKVETTDRLTTATPTFTSVSAGFDSVTFTVRNNDSSTVTMYYEVNDSTPDITATVGAGASITRTLSGLNSGQNYTLYARAIASGKNMSSTRSSGFTTSDPGPGPSSLIAGNSTTGFFGEISQAEFGKNMADIFTDLNYNTSSYPSFNLNEPLLKFVHGGTIKFINKKPIGYYSEFNYIINRFANAGGTPYMNGLVVSFGGYTYRMRLMRGWGQTNDSNSNYGTGPIRGRDYDAGSGGNNGANWPTSTSDWNENSPNEWNTLMFPISGSSQSQTGNVPNWASYSDIDLGVGGFRTGSGTTVLETPFSNNVYLRGRQGIADISTIGYGSSSSSSGLRLVFELI